MNQDIFSYTIGNQQIWADPFEVDLGLREILHADPETIRAKATSADPEAPQVMRAFLAALRQVFHLPPVNQQTGQGVTSNKVIGIWNEWVDYCLKKNGIPESAPTSPPLESAPSITNPSPSGSGSGFGFTPTELSGSKPQPSAAG